MQNADDCLGDFGSSGANGIFANYEAQKGTDSAISATPF